MRPQLFYSERYCVDIGAHVFPMVKYRLIRDALLSSGTAAVSDFVEPQPATREDALLVHTSDYIERLIAGTLDPIDVVRLELPYSSELVEASFLGAGGTISAVRSCVGRGVGVNMAGGFHHAFPDHGEGFCVLNDVAMGVARALADGLAGRVGIVDCDVHQGNGTAAIFRGDERVFTFSIHQEFNYPFVKPPSTLDVGLPNGAGVDEYLPHVRDAVERILGVFGADLVVYVAGADPYRDDLLGGLALSKADLAERDRVVMEACLARSVPFAVVLAGGYAARTSDTVEIQSATVARAVAAGEGAS